MKKFLVLSFLVLGSAGIAHAGKNVQNVIIDGKNLSVALEACIDPVTKKPEPCYVIQPESAQLQNANDACYDPVTGRLEPCL